MKKSKVLVAVFLLGFSLLLAACNIDNDNGINGQDPGGESPTEGPGDPTQSESITVDEQVLYNEGDIFIELKSLDEEGIFGPSLKVLIENNRDEDIMVQTRGTTVNDLVVDTIFSANVVAGKSSNDEITFSQDSLDKAGIEIIKDIELRFSVSDADSWGTLVETDIISISTSADPAFEQTYDDSGQVVLDQDGYRVVVKRVSSEDSFWGADVYVFIENNSDKAITIQTRDVSINGFMVDPIFSSDIPAGKKAYDTITFMESDLEDNDISSIDELEMVLHIIEKESWDTLLDTDPIVVNFE
ncbi:MAG TPA: hypothetical protein VFD33_07985 [Bacillota bacterium]|nr:hypothetical protein [Bacillota bacterium]